MSSALNINITYQLPAFDNFYAQAGLMSFHEAETEWHSGEEYMHKLLRVPQHENPTSPFLSPFAASLLVRSPLVALGTLDSESWPWTTLWGGKAGFSQPVAQSVIGLKTTVDRIHDPVLRALLGDGADGEVVQGKDGGQMVGGLAIDLQNRRRVKLYGRSVAGAVQGTEEGVGEVQLVVKIEQSLGNCPKYLNKKRITPHIPQPNLVTESFPLPQAAADLVAKADLFFISSSNHNSDMDTNIRGGPPGFVRILANDETGLTLVYPEYSGNRLYQTLGNLQTTPRAGLVFPDFETGDVLYVTGTTEIFSGKAAKELISHTNLAVKIQVKKLRYVTNSLGFRGHLGEPSPYNPPVRLLSIEKGNTLAENSKQVLAKLINKQVITPTIARFRFQIEDPDKSSKWKPGQYVALSFQDELDIGYSHMRDDDPQSINDDFLRTFTCSSRQGELNDRYQFEITIRKLGPVTGHLFATNPRVTLEVPIQGFGGEFFIQQGGEDKVSFIAGGVGITPVLAQAADLDLTRFKLYWTLRGEDLAFASDTFSRIPGLAKSTRLFLTGKINEFGGDWEAVQKSGAEVRKGRMVKADLEDDEAGEYYLCTGKELKKVLLGWLEGKSVVFEDFNY